MVGQGSIEERVRRSPSAWPQERGLELVHAEVAGPEGKPIVRIFIDKPGGVTHEDCSEVSLHVGTVLDVEDFIHSAYTLEVSSPGLERGLYKRAGLRALRGRVGEDEDARGRRRPAQLPRAHRRRRGRRGRLRRQDERARPRAASRQSSRRILRSTWRRSFGARRSASWQQRPRQSGRPQTQLNNN